MLFIFNVMAIIIIIIIIIFTYEWTGERNSNKVFFSLSWTCLKNSLRQDIQLWTYKIYKRNNYVSYENGYKLLLYISYFF